MDIGGIKIQTKKLFVAALVALILLAFLPIPVVAEDNTVDEASTQEIDSRELALLEGKVVRQMVRLGVNGRDAKSTVRLLTTEEIIYLAANTSHISVGAGGSSDAFYLKFVTRGTADLIMILITVAVAG